MSHPNEANNPVSATPTTPPSASAPTGASGRKRLPLMWPVFAIVALTPLIATISTWWTSSTDLAGQRAMGAIAIGAVAFALVGSLAWVMHRTLRPLSAVRDAMEAMCEGEPSTGALLVDPRLGLIAEAWNRHLARVDQTRCDLAVQSVQTRSTPGRVGSSAVERMCDSLWQGFVVIEPGGRRVSYANTAACAMLGKPADAIVGKPIGDVFEDQGLRKALGDASSGHGPTRATVEIRRESGAAGGGADQTHVLRYNVCRSNVGSGGGTPTVAIVIEDLTQQRESDRVRDAFVAQTAHELRTPLTNIRLYVERAQDEGQDDPAIQRESLNAINQESRRLERIVGDMLSVSEIEAGHWKLARGDVRLDTVFDELRLGHEASASEKEITLNFSLPPKLPVISGDRDKILLALHNLVGNAIKYTLPGGDVSVEVEVEGDVLVIAVRDSGIGIAAHETEKVFEKFHRAQDARVANVTGTGLGLTLARDVIRMHGGDIRVQSQLNKGSTFTVTLPAPAVPATVGAVGGSVGQGGAAAA